MNDIFLNDEALNEGPTTPVWAVADDELESWLETRPKRHQTFVRAARFTARAGQTLMVPDEAGGIEGVIFGVGKADDPCVLAGLAEAIGPGRWRLERPVRGQSPEQMGLAWALATYRFDRYKPGPDVQPERPALHIAEGFKPARTIQLASAMGLVRDLVNTPAEEMGPAELEAAAAEVASAHGATPTVIVGDDLIEQNFPLVHAVGRASTRAPRLIDFSWGHPDHPRVTLVGKGVCFDTGGLDIKPAQYMRNMKKDMGGAAHVLGLARLIMEAALKVRLRVLVPAVDNNVDGNAFRPGDVFRSRKGLTVEIGNTDAEGRLILADALALADEEAPDLLIDLATLTGAARVALGAEIPPFYTDDASIAEALMAHAEAEQDPVWRMPLWSPYDRHLDSRIADVCHISDVPKGGSITAALFLRRFVEAAERWVHVDVYAWNDGARPGRPAGGEAQGLRALFAMLEARYGSEGRS